MKAVRVLVVDDSALVRQMLTELLDGDPMIEVVGTASDPYVARDRIKKLNPDVLTLDVEMPRMDGVTFLKNLMRLRPMPVVMISTLTARGAAVTLQALELGAVDFVPKPKLDAGHGLEEYAREIREKVKVAAGAQVSQRAGLGSAQCAVPTKLSGGAALGQGHRPAKFRATEQIVAIGASTGGTEAIKEVLMRMPADAPPAVITQHIPREFSGPFARRMNEASRLSVCEAQDGQLIVPGHAYIAPGDRHLLVVRVGPGYVCRLHDGPPVNRHRPSVDVMFRSVATSAGANAVGVILTGMGSDGALGLKEMRAAGAQTFAQDEATSVVWGMPGEAVKVGAVSTVVPLERMTAKVLHALIGYSRILPRKAMSHE